ncbi:unnamed protein product [Ectocarpus sp. 12 AP-2014]
MASKHPFRSLEPTFTPLSLLLPVLLPPLLPTCRPNKADAIKHCPSTNLGEKTRKKTGHNFEAPQAGKPLGSPLSGVLPAPSLCAALLVRLFLRQHLCSFDKVIQRPLPLDLRPGSPRKTHTKMATLKPRAGTTPPCTQ